MKLIALIFCMFLFASYAHAQNAAQLQQAHQFCQTNYRQGNHYTLPECDKIDKKLSMIPSHAAQQTVTQPPLHGVNPALAARLARIAADQRAKSAADSQSFIKDMAK